MVRLWTVGHSTHPIDTFIAMLRGHGIELLMDVRTVPRSRTNPQFNRDTLPASLAAANIAYDHMRELGGLRATTPDSPNQGWRNASFRGYADYMQTAEFGEAVDRLVTVAGGKRVAVMCAEAVHWRCHRSLIADAMVARGHAVEHIQTATRSAPHRLAAFAVVDESGRVTYPAQPGSL